MMLITNTFCVTLEITFRLTTAHKNFELVSFSGLVFGFTSLRSRDGVYQIILDDTSISFELVSFV